MTKVIITGFGPFLSNHQNPSQKVCEEIKAADFSPFTLIPLILPVSFHVASKKLEEKILELRPEIVLSLGLASERTQIEIEKVALNFRHASAPDNQGKIAHNEKINPHLPDCYMTNLPYMQMLETFKELGISARLSLSAGSYVCNEVFFTLMNLACAHSFHAGFIHLPAQGDAEFLHALLPLLKTVMKQ